MIIKLVNSQGGELIDVPIEKALLLVEHGNKLIIPKDKNNVIEMFTLGCELGGRTRSYHQHVTFV